MSSASQSVSSNSATTPALKRTVTRIKKQTTNATTNATTKPTFPAPMPTPKPNPPPTSQSVSAIPVDAENITISHSIRIIKDPVTNSYTYSYIKSDGDEALDANTHNNGFDSDSNSNSNDSDDSSSVDSNDSDSEQNRYLLSSAKEIAAKLNTQSIDMEGCEPLYSIKQITYDILLPFILINMHASSRSNILALLNTTVISCIEGRCISEGFIKPESVRIIDFKCGKIIGKNVQFNLVIECLICNPVEQTVICCFAKNITQAGIRALSADEHLPVVVYIARDYNSNNPNTYYNSIKEGDAIKVRIIGKRFEINDKNIQIIGDLVVPKKERSVASAPAQQKTKLPPIIIDGTVTTTTTTTTSTAYTSSSTTSAPASSESTISKPQKASKTSKEPKAQKEPKAPKESKAPKEPKAPKAPKKIKKNDVAAESLPNEEQ
jgi:DNA-directed RNA polymerase subunit E'/Rpb7